MSIIYSNNEAFTMCRLFLKSINAEENALDLINIIVFL